MTRLLALLFIAACAHHTPVATPAPDPLAGAHLMPINSTGDTMKSLPGGANISVGLAQDASSTWVVRVDGSRLAIVFALPATIDGAPAQYMIDPAPAVDGVEPAPGSFSVVGSASIGEQIHVSTWVVTWNAAKAAFDVGAPTTAVRENRCDVCLEST